MAKIKSYTDLEQSKKLAEILPHESADMYYACGAVTPDIMIGSKQDYRCYTMCWSLAALLNILPKIVNNETLFIETSTALWHIGYRNIYTARAGNPVDACVEMIVWLLENGYIKKEQKTADVL